MTGKTRGPEPLTTLGNEVSPKFLEWLDWCDKMDADPKTSNKILKKKKGDSLFG